MITLSAYAKINLFLEVTGRRPDGYHDIESIMQSISLADTVNISFSDKDEFYISDPALDTADNIAIKAKEAFFAHLGQERRGVRIEIEKRIPVAAGLAGGSADCAAVLRGLNILFNKPFDANTLCAIGKTLGADVPFCILCGTRMAKGIGEVLSPLPDMPQCHIAVAIGEGRVSTRAAFEKIDSHTQRSIRSGREAVRALESGSLDKISAALFNVFEYANDYEADIKTVMLNKGASSALMSGSGPSVFGLFGTAEKAEAAREELKARGFTAHVCVPVKANDF